MKYFKDIRVSIILKTVRYTKDSNNGNLENVTFVGKVLDEDKEFLYIAQEGDEVDVAIHKTEIAMILNQDNVELYEALESADEENVQ